MIHATLSTIARIWKQPKHPSAEEWIEKMWHKYTMEYCSAIKKNEIMPLQQHGWTWRLSCRRKEIRHMKTNTI